MKQALKILMVEDVESDAKLDLHELERAELTIDVRGVDTESDFRRALDEFRPHVILSDFSLPTGFGGLRALQVAQEQAPDIPFVFIAGTVTEDLAAEAMKRGATDYVFRDCLSRLAPVVERALREADERAARRRAELWRDGQNRLLELVATGACLADMLNQLVLTVESQAAGMLCSILLLDADGAHLRVGAAPSLPESYNRTVDEIAIGPTVGSCGTAAYRREQVVVSDIATDPLWANYRELAARHGLGACWSTPVLSRDGSLLGTFANYFRTPRDPNPAELELVASATHIARIAIEKRRDEAEILRAKERLDLALEASGVALWDNDISSGRIYFSEHWGRLLHNEPGGSVMTVPGLIRLAHPDDRRMLHEAASDTISGRRSSYYAEARVMGRNGEWKWILSRGKVVERSVDGHALRVIGTTVDITQRKLQEQRMARLSRIHAALSGITSVIVRARDRQELFDEACRIAVEYCQFGFAWIGIYDEDKLEVTPVASAGLPPDSELRSSKLIVRHDAPQRGSVAATAIRERRLVYNNDIALDADPGNARRQEAIRRGYRSAVALPLIVSGEVYGSFSLNAKEPDFFDEDERKLLTKLAGDISFALEHLASRERLEYLSFYDTLTGLPNRTLFIDRTGQQLRGRGGEVPLVAVILVNLDRFRNINETFGRSGGDDLLQQVARRLEVAFRGKDYLARTAADTFGVVIRGMRDAASVAHALDSQVFASFQQPFTIRGQELRAAVRAGVALFPADGADADALFKNAEAALKKAKDTGEHYLFYAPDMNARAAHALSLENRLRKAVERQQFVLHYQPRIDLASDTVCGLEALIRWNDPDAGLVPPIQFIPLLEETGMILEVGRWAIERALSQHLEWSIGGRQPPPIAVNVSALQLQQHDFADMVIAAVQQGGQNPGALGIEITESLLMKDIQASIRKLSKLRGLGIEIAMDDFGTGYSSLSYLARLPINSVKIDRSFITAMTGSEQDMGIVTTIIALAHSLNLKVVAEGVEAKEQAQLLKFVRCDEAQGFLYSKPVPAAEIEPLLPGSSARPRGAAMPVVKPASRTTKRRIH